MFNIYLFITNFGLFKKISILYFFMVFLNEVEKTNKSTALMLYLVKSNLPTLCRATINKYYNFAF